jgi:hypothetical protein
MEERLMSLPMQIILLLVGINFIGPGVLQVMALRVLQFMALLHVSHQLLIDLS